MKKLIVTADDFGLTAKVNEAIAIASKQGVVTTASLLVTGKGFESAVEIARSQPSLDLGLHLNLTEGKPASPWSSISSLAQAGGFLYSHPVRLAAAFALRRVRLMDLEREIRAQIEKAIQTGLQITHIDGHKHVHAIPTVVGLISRIAPEYRIHAIRSTVENVPHLRSLLGRNRGRRKQILLQYGFGKVLSTAWTISRAANRRHHLVSPRRLYGVTQTGFLDFEAFEEMLRDLSDGFNEVMCHPGYVDDDLKQTPTRLHSQRERELELLTSDELRSLLKHSGITLGTYKDLFENSSRGAATECSPGREPGVLVSKR